MIYPLGKAICQKGWVNGRSLIIQPFKQLKKQKGCYDMHQHYRNTHWSSFTE